MIADVDVTQAAVAPPRRSRPSSLDRLASSSLTRWGVLGLAYLGLAVLVMRPVLSEPSARVWAENDDPALFAWWLASTARALVGGTGLLYSDHLNYPDGVNGAWNTSVVALGIPAAPITSSLGPVVAYNVLVLLAPVAASLCAAAALSRWVRLPAAGIAGGVYGFSPYVLGQMQGHLNLAWAVLPPVVLAGVGELLCGRRSPWRVGVLLGVAVGIQLYLSTELLAATALMTIVTLAVCAVLRTRLVRERAGALARAAVATAVTGLVVGAPLLLRLRGPVAPRGAIREPGYWNADPLSLVVPPATVRWQPVPDLSADVASHLDPSEQGLFVGLPLLLLMFAAAIVLRRHPLVVLATAVTALAAVLSFGSVLRVRGGALDLLLPWDVAERLPVLESVLPMRLGVFVALAASSVLAVVLDTVLRAHGRRRALGVAICLACLLPLVPASAQPRDLAVPAWFQDGGGVQDVPEGAVIKTVPQARAAARPGPAEPMLWQAVSGLRYRTTGGYFVGSTATEPVILQGPADGFDTVAERVAAGAGAPEPGSPEHRSALAALEALDVHSVVVVPGEGRDSAAVTEWVAGLVGTRPIETGGVIVLPRGQR